MSIKKVVLQVFTCAILMGCTSYCPDTIVVYYLHGFVDTSISKTCLEMKKMAMNDESSRFVRYDTICITHSDFLKLRNYVSNPKLVPEKIKNVGGLDSRIVVVYDTLAVSFETTTNQYGENSRNEIVYANNEIVYLLKSLSGYYNYFDKEDLLQFFPEIKEFGIPKTYKRVRYPAVDNTSMESITPLHSRVVLESR